MNLAFLLLLFASLTNAGGNMRCCERACSDFKNCCACFNKREKNIIHSMETNINYSPVTHNYMYYTAPQIPDQNGLILNETDEVAKNDNRKRVCRDSEMKRIRSFSDETDRDKNNIFHSFGNHDDFDVLFNCGARSADCSFDVGNIVDNPKAERCNPKLKKNEQNSLNLDCINVENDKDKKNLNPEQIDRKKCAEAEIQVDNNLILNEIEQDAQNENRKAKCHDSDMKKNIQNVRSWIDETDKVKKNINYAEVEIQVGNNLILNETEQERHDSDAQCAQSNNVVELISSQEKLEEELANQSLPNQNMRTLDKINELPEKNYDLPNSYKVFFLWLEKGSKTAKQNKRKSQLQVGDWNPELEDDMNDILTPSPNRRSDKKTQIISK